MKYCVIIASHRPPKIFFGMLRTLSRYNSMRIYIIDSSPEEIANGIFSYVQNLNEINKATIFLFFHIKNMGVGNKYNFGIDRCLIEGCHLITLLTDDVIIDESKFDPDRIMSYFSKYCDPKKDILSLVSEDRISVVDNDVHKIHLAVDTGMTFSSELIRKFRFNECFVIDQVDTYYCYLVIKSGGKMITFDASGVSSLPVGREVSGSQHCLPYWRLYLLARNSLWMFLEERDLLLFKSFFFQTRFWSLRGVESNQKISKILFSVTLGIIDALTNKLGVTSSLQKLSGNRFDSIPEQALIK